MLPQELIRKKRDGQALTDDEIAQVVRGITENTFTESQVSAFAMAVFFRGMTAAERVAFTRAMTHSGPRSADWDEHAASAGPMLDKHSTGGVGDKVSIMLAPIVAACGGVVPMIAGRGLGHTGGTLDKMGCIPGYVVNPDIETFQRVTREVGCAIIGQTIDLAPADRRPLHRARRDRDGGKHSVDLRARSCRRSWRQASSRSGDGREDRFRRLRLGRSARRRRIWRRRLVSIGAGAGLPITRR